MTTRATRDSRSDFAIRLLLVFTSGAILAPGQLIRDSSNAVEPIIK